MNKNDLRVLKTKQGLQQALLEILKFRTLDQISITELCKRARVNRGTFYLHYSQVGDLFEEYFQELIADLEISYQEPYLHVITLDARNLDPHSIRIFHHVKKYEDFYRIVFSKNVSLTYYYMFFDQIKMLLQKDISPQLNKTIDQSFFASYMANAIIGLVVEWAKHDFEETPTYMNQQLVSILKEIGK